MEEITFENISFHYPETHNTIFENLSLTLSEGITTFVGQNGTGKSTLLLLAAGILLPDAGKVYIQGIDTTQLRDEQERQRYVSYIFQNMEFESEESIETLLRFVEENGFRDKKDDGLMETLIQVFELEPCLQKRTQEVSKGELQRTILAFSVLYGSRILIMDEPIFAMEDSQKRRAMKFLTEFARNEHVSLYYSVHELDISQKYSDYALLFRESAPPLFGSTAEILTREHLEDAYEVPLSFLKQKERLYRAGLQETWRGDATMN